MLAASSHLLPAVGGGDMARREVIGELVDASHLSSEDYAELLQDVGEISRAITMALCALLILDCSWIVWRGSKGRVIRTTCTSTALSPCCLVFHDFVMYERIRCEVRPSPGTGPCAPTVMVWAYEYCRPLTGTNFRLVADGNWPALMRSEGKR